MADTVAPVPLVGGSILAAAIPSLPPTIELAQQPPAALLLAATLSAIVVGRAGNGALLLRTDYGTLALKTALALASGSRVELKLLPGPPPSVLLLDIEEPETPAQAAATAAPMPNAPAAPGSAATPPAAAAASETEAPPAQLDLGSEVEATLVSPPPGTQNLLPALAAGTRLVLRIALPEPDAPAPTPTPSGPPPVSVAGTVMPAVPDGNGRTALQTPWGVLLLDQRLTLPPGTSLTLTPLATTPPASGELAMGTVIQARVLSPPPGAPAPALPSGTQLTLRAAVLPAMATAAPTLPAVVPAMPAAERAPTETAMSADFIGRVVATNAGETVVDTPVGTLALEQRLALPPGTLLGLQRLAASPPAPPDDAPVTQSATWPALAQTLSVLDRVQPDLAAALRGELTPASGQQLAGTLLFLMSALNNGVWPGAKVATALDAAGERDLRLRLDGDVEELRRLAEPASGDWRVFVLPLLEGGLIRPVRLYLRRRSGGAAAPEQGARFVLEVDTSRLGALQLDGLVRAQRFDLVLRSHRAIDAEMRLEIAAVFRSATAASGLAGDISFTTASRFAVAPLDALRAHVGLTA